MPSTYTVELIHDPRALIFTPYHTYRLGDDHAVSTQSVQELLDQQREPIPYIANFTALVCDFDEMMEATSRVTRGEHPIYHHPMMKKVILVSSDDDLIAIFRGMDNPAFGNVKVHIVSTLDEGLIEAAR